MQLKAQRDDEKLRRELVIEKRKEKILEKMQMRKEWKQLGEIFEDERFKDMFY